MIYCHLQESLPTPQSLATPYSPQYISETSSNDTPSLSRPVKRQRILDDDDDDDCVTLAISDDVHVSVDESFDLKKRYQKTEDDEIPLPDPFPLPKNYKASIEVALKSGQMALETKRQFLSSVAAAMFAFKQYPSKDDFQNVARCIITKYSFLKPPHGSPYVSFDSSFIVTIYEYY